jgi:hypothetical protein
MVESVLRGNIYLLILPGGTGCYEVNLYSFYQGKGPGCMSDLMLPRTTVDTNSISILLKLLTVAIGDWCGVLLFVDTGAGSWSIDKFIVLVCDHGPS